MSEIIIWNRTGGYSLNISISQDQNDLATFQSTGRYTKYTEM